MGREGCTEAAPGQLDPAGSSSSWSSGSIPRAILSSRCSPRGAHPGARVPAEDQPRSHLPASLSLAEPRQPRFPESLTSHSREQGPRRPAGTPCCPNPAQAC